MRVRPEDPTVDAVDHLHEVVVIVPVDRNEDEAEEVDGELWHERPQVVQAAAGGWTEAEDHDRDDHGDNAVAERFETARAHGGNGAFHAKMISGSRRARIRRRAG